MIVCFFAVIGWVCIYGQPTKEQKQIISLLTPQEKTQSGRKQENVKQESMANSMKKDGKNQSKYIAFCSKYKLSPIAQKRHSQVG